MTADTMLIFETLNFEPFFLSFFPFLFTSFNSCQLVKLVVSIVFFSVFQRCSVFHSFLPVPYDNADILFADHHVNFYS